MVQLLTAKLRNIYMITKKKMFFKRIVNLFFIPTLFFIYSFVTVTNIAAQQESPASGQKITISANYILSNLNLSGKYYRSGSILTWRDIHLHGAQVNVEFANAPFGFNKTNIGISYSASFHGHFIDDDVYNNADIISATSVDVSLLEISYKILSEKGRINPMLGIDFSCLLLKNYDYKVFTSYYFEQGEGLAATYDIYKLGFYGGMQLKLIDSKILYLNASVQAGIGSFLGLADWVLRSAFLHPVSFYNFGLSLITYSDLDLVFKLGRFSVFSKVQIAYEISPWLGVDIQRQRENGNAGQPVFLELSRISFNAGIKRRF